MGGLRACGRRGTRYQDATSDLDLSFAFADNRLQGSQTLPRSWLDAPSQDDSRPDIQTNRFTTDEDR
jgi:iron complex outermembrane receptor protein